MINKENSGILLCLKDKMLMDVAKENTTSMWTKLESLYMTKSIVSNLETITIFI